MKNIHYFLIALLVSLMLSSAAFAGSFELDLYRPTSTGVLLYDPAGRAPNMLGYVPPNPKPVISGAIYSGLSPAPKISYNTITDIPTSAGVKQLTLARTAPINLGSLGVTVAKFARAAGPVNMGITAATLICTLSDICKNAITDLWEKKADPGLLGYPSSTPNTYGWTASGWNSSVTQNAMSVRTPTAAVSCSNLVIQMNSDPYWAIYRQNGAVMTGAVTASTATTATCTIYGGNNGVPMVPQVFSNFVATLGTCPLGYSANSQGGCTLNGNPIPHPVQESEWNDAGKKLGNGDFVPTLVEAGEPVPVTTPTRIPLVRMPIDTQTEPTTDPAGNITGTKETKKELVAEDVSTAAAPNTFNITENTTITNYNTNNQVINTTNTTTQISAPPPVAAAADPVTFDGVTDATIQTVQVNPPSDSTSWGEGSCPAPQTLTTMFGQVVIPTAPACDFATMIKPIVLLSAAVAAMFIVSGIKEAT